MHQRRTQVRQNPSNWRTLCHELSWSSRMSAFLIAAYSSSITWAALQFQLCQSHAITRRQLKAIHRYPVRQPLGSVGRPDWRADFASSRRGTTRKVHIHKPSRNYRGAPFSPTRPSPTLHPGDKLIMPCNDRTFYFRSAQRANTDDNSPTWRRISTVDDTLTMQRWGGHPILIC